MDGCFSVHSSFQQFVLTTNALVGENRTIEELGFNPVYPLGKYVANVYNLTRIESGRSGQLIYHYATATLRPDMVCHYHLVVDSQTHLVVGWGFDAELGDPRKTCGAAG